METGENWDARRDPIPFHILWHREAGAIVVWWRWHVMAWRDAGAIVVWWRCWHQCRLSGIVQAGCRHGGWWNDVNEN